jgi:hypothetical protein
MNFGNLKKVKSLEQMMRESSSLNMSQNNSFSNTPNEVSTLGSDKDTLMLSTTQEDMLPPPPTSVNRPNYKTSHFETILLSQRHTELVTKLECHNTNIQAIISKQQKLLDLFKDMGTKLLSIEANVTLLTQLISDSSNTPSLPLKMISTKASSSCHVAEQLQMSTPATKNNQQTQLPTIGTKRKQSDSGLESQSQISKDEDFVNMSDYMKLKTRELAFMKDDASVVSDLTYVQSFSDKREGFVVTTPDDILFDEL